VIHILNQQDPGNALVRNSFALAVPFEISEVTSVHVQPCLAIVLLGGIYSLYSRIPGTFVLLMRLVRTVSY